MNKTGYTIVCEYCGKESYQTKTQYNRAKHHFCSFDCSIKWRSEQTKEIRKCEICEKEFEVNKSDKKRFCSTKCQSKWQKTLVGEKNSRYKQINGTCSWCNKLIKIRNYKKDKENHFCNNICRQEWYANIWCQQEEWKEKSRRKLIDTISSGKISTTQSKPQTLIDKLLTDLNIKFSKEFDVKYYAIDNYLKEHNLMIEVMGDYWHVNPNRFSQINEMQYKNIAKDKRKHSYINNQYNIQILYLWESDILYNIDLCKYLILQYIENKGELSNYHSFNYELLKDKLILKTDIITPYFETDISYYSKLKIS